MKIGIAFSLKPADRCDDGPDDRYEEFDQPETVEAIANVIRGEGHDVLLLGDGREFLERVLRETPDFVWNMAEGEGIGRNREARVPAVCEMLGIPYSGSDPLTLAVSLDKSLAKRLMDKGVKVPKGMSVRGGIEFKRSNLEFAITTCFKGCGKLILKPAFEGSSKGIRGDCLVDGPAEAFELWQRLTRDYRQPILIEEFIVGDEVTVGLVGNGDDVACLGSMRVVPKVPSDHFVYSLDVKRDWARRVDYEVPARLTRSIQRRIHDAARDVYRALQCRDVARIDFRIRDGIPYFIEANPLPGLTPGVSDLVILAEGNGIDYADLIRRILQTALSRVGLARPAAVAS